MYDKMTKLVDKYYEYGIFDKEYSKESLKYILVDKLKTIKKNKDSIFKRITDTGDTMAYYRYELLELENLPSKKIAKKIESIRDEDIKNSQKEKDNPLYKIEECRDYMKKFNKYFKLQNRDKLFFKYFYMYLFENYGESNIKLEGLIRDFYGDYEHSKENMRNRVDVSDLTKLLHFIRKGNTPLYNKKYRDFFCLTDIDKMINIPKEANNKEKIESKRRAFKQQYYFINSVFDEIMKNSVRKSNQNKIKIDDVYDFSKYFESFEDKFYITDKGVTKHKMIDYSILYFN